MNQPQSLIIEVRTVEVDSSTDFDRSQVNNLIIHRDRQNNYHLSLQQLNQLRAAIIDIIPRLGSNYRHPLLFNVQVIPGDEVDSIIASVPKRDRRQRRPK